MSLVSRSWVGLQGLFLLFWAVVVVRLDIAIVTELDRFGPAHLLLVTPFNAVLVAVAYTLGLRLACARDDKGGATVVADGALTRVRPPTSTPVAIALGVAVVFSAALFVALLLGSDGHPPRWGGAVGLAMVGVFTFWVVWVQARESGKTTPDANDIVIDDVAHTLVAPSRDTQPSPQPFPWSAVETIRVEEEEPARFERAPQWRYLVTVTRKDSWNVTPLGRWPNATSARRFRDWLARRIKMGALEY